MAAPALPSQLEWSAGKYTTAPAFPELRFLDPTALVPLPHTSTLLVLERGGRIYAFDNQRGAREKRLVLDLSAVTLGAQDSGLLSLVFHPKFGVDGAASRRFAYVHYAYSKDPTQRRTPEDATPTQSRLVRFEVDPRTGKFDRGSEQVLIDQLDESLYHQGGALLFRPSDGFLYVSSGDEGTPYVNSQKLDKDLYGGVLRIDVDQRGGAVSHPIRRQPESGATANYYIPNDNPFVGVAGALEEFYAMGLRNPHRMTLDAPTDRIWVGDVGQREREEIDILLRGANYQWDSIEGTRYIRPAPKPRPGLWTGPILELKRDVAGGIIGGHVYRGTRSPELAGRYLFADFVTGNIWALRYEDDGPSVRVRDNQLLLQTQYRSQLNGITSLGMDAAGELYFLTLGRESQLLELRPSQTGANAPALLSATGVFSDLAKLTPAAGALPYTVASPLFSDGADKQRFVLLPPGGKIDFSSDGPWHFPPGTVFVKHFALARDERQPERLSPLETRLLVAGGEGRYYGVTYEWNAEGTDAKLVLERKELELPVRGRNGRPAERHYMLPGPGDCMVCHNDKAGMVLGVRTEQMQVADQLSRWEAAGAFAQPPSAEALEHAQRLAALDDESRSEEDRLRSYWASNCSMCHGVDNTIRSRWDARATTPLEHQGIVRGPLENGAPLAGSAVVVPGDLERSVMYQRGLGTGAGFAMPPLGRRTRDEAYLTLLRRWIQSLAKP
ncbi:MAG: hypothetical protein RL685_6238 [Pseudomonadota bacterium]